MAFEATRTAAEMRDQLCETVESILRDKAVATMGTEQPGSFAIRRVFTEEELIAIDLLFGPVSPETKSKLSREFHRHRRINELQERAGTSEQRATARARLEEAEQAVAAREPALRQQIAEAQKQLHELESQHAAAAQEVESRHKAVIALRDCLPEHVLKRHQGARAEVEQEFAELRTAESRLQFIETAIAADPNDSRGRDTVWFIAEAHAPEVLILDSAGNADRTAGVNRDRWAVFVSGLKREGAELRPRIAALKKERAQRLSSLDAELDSHFAR